MEYKELIDSLFREKETFNKLTEEQERAVFSRLGPVCINSGAGTGKTHVLVNRMYHLMGNENIRPQRILLLSFAGRATWEIKKRIYEEIGLSFPDNKYIRTFHSLFKEILSENIHRIDQSLDNFHTIGTEERDLIIREICRELNISKHLDEIKTSISPLKRSGFSEAELEKISKKFMVQKSHIVDAYQKYHEKLRGMNALDFDDYEMKVLELFRRDEKTRERWRNKFDAICIDEFQDISNEQLEIIMHLTNPDYNIFIVGDPDQSIYGFRDINSNLLFERFLSHFRDVSMLKLEQNFRSTKNILAIANLSMDKHPKDEKLYKRLWTEREEGEKVSYVRFENAGQEMDWIVEKIGEMIENQGVDPEEIAILCRNNLPADMMNRLKEKINVGVLSVYENNFLNLREIEFMTSALHLSILGVVDFDHLETFLNSFWFNVKIKEDEIGKFCDWARRNKYTLSEALDQIERCQISRDEANVLKEVGELLVSGEPEDDVGRLEGLVSRLLNYNKSFRNKVIDGDCAIRNIWRLISKIKQHQKNYPLEYLVRNIRLLDFPPMFEGQDPSEEDESPITVSTIHKAKGLEFDCVFLMGVSARYFPNSSKAVDKNEERRIAHVAYTRAKKKLIITCPNRLEESEFIDSDIKNSPSFLAIN